MKKLNIRNLLYILLLTLVVSFTGYAVSVEDPQDKARIGMAMSYNNLKQYEKAAALLEKLYGKYPDNTEIAIELAKALGFSGNWQEADGILTGMLKSDPDNQRLNQLHIAILESNQQFEQARDKYLELYRKHPDGNLILKIAELSGWLKDYPTSIEYYKKIISTTGDDRQVYLKIADMSFWMKDYSQAIAYYDKAAVQPEDHKRYESLGYCYLETKQTKKAIEIFELLSKKDPDGIEYKEILAGSYYGQGKLDKAQQGYEAIKEINPADSVSAAKLAEIYATKRQYQKAIHLCNDILKDKPQDKEVLLLIARVQSWARHYDESIQSYDKLIVSEPNWLLPRREKARVLGWTRRYDQAIAEYQKAITYNTDSRVVVDEMNAKYGLYNYYDRMAEKYYKRWLNAEPDNLEAVYDLGQVYSRQGRWRKAASQYDNVLKLFPAHFRAADALEKVNIYSKESQLKAGIDFVEADSSGRSTDMRWWNVFASIRKPLSEQYYLTIEQNNTWYGYSGLSQVYRQGFSVELEYSDKPDLRASVHYAHGIFDGKQGVKNTFGGRVNIKPYDSLDIILSHQRLAMLDNALTFASQLYRDDYMARGIWRPGRRIRFAGDYIRSNYSDGNIRDQYGFDAAYYITFEPASLMATYRYEHYEFARHDQDYFSPSSFHCHVAGLKFKHVLNSDELYWGSNDTWYGIGYEARFDYNLGHEVGHRINVNFSHDWNDRVSSRLEWSKTMYETSEIYSENRLMFYTSVYF